MLESRDLPETIKFYTGLLGFEAKGLYPDDKNPCWASLSNGVVEIMFTSRNGHTTIEDTNMTGSLYFNTDNVDEVWESLKDKTTIEYPIENFDYGMREFAIRDCNGYILQFGQGVSEK